MRGRRISEPMAATYKAGDDSRLSVAFFDCIARAFGGLCGLGIHIRSDSVHVLDKTACLYDTNMAIDIHCVICI